MSCGYYAPLPAFTGPDAGEVRDNRAAMIEAARKTPVGVTEYGDTVFQLDDNVQYWAVESEYDQYGRWVGTVRNDYVPCGNTLRANQTRMRIINLTQHPSTPEQRAAGAFDLAGDELAKLKRELTFESLPKDEWDIRSRATVIALLAADHQPRPEAAMIGGAMWLMAPLARELRAWGIKPLFAFSVRETEEQVQPDGSVRKVAVFRHAGFVPAVE